MKNEKNIYKFFVKMLLIFVGLDLLMMCVTELLASSSLFAKYGTDVIYEIFYALSILVVMLLFHNSYVFTEKKKKFWNSIYLGLPMLAYSIITFIVNLFNQGSFSISNCINVFVLCLFVGIAEEFLCRGWLQNEFIERFSNDRNSVIKSIILSSLVFGVMHIINLSEQTVFETILQIINAVSVGVLLGSIYYKTKNIWSVIFLHAFYDFALFLADMNTIKECTFGVATPNITIYNSITIVLLTAFWLLSALIVLKNCNFPDKKESAGKDFYVMVIPALVFILAVNVLPLQNLVEGYDDYYVCYDYKTVDQSESYELHIPNYNEYLITADTENDSLLLDKDRNEIQEVLTTNNVQIRVQLVDGKVVITNLRTGYSIELEYDHDVYAIELVKNAKGYEILIETDYLESNVYYSNFVTIDNLSNSKEYLDMLKESFRKLELPLLSKMGYINLGEEKYYYPYMLSTNGDEFMIVDGELFLIKRD